MAQGALEASHGDAPEGVAGLFHQVPLHAVGSANKQHLHLGILFLHIACQGQGGVHMARRAAAGKDHVHIASS